uniref:WD repeat-containing protein 74-like n=1 Tax=Ciona intestinalis TaxID=7719 RepID=UPI000180D282|nr:WD repeat-containing protein 74-like [Ciona intestinalis]|eukprot:XP_026690830.1 WD repeat-containing protein 74-like [Ciona intestinalis]
MVENNGCGSQNNVWVGSETGLLKSVNLCKKLATNHYDKDNYGKEHEIQRICWEYEDRSVLYTAHKNGVVRKLETANGGYVDSFQIPEMEGKIAGLARLDSNFITCTSNGDLRLWSNENESLASSKAGDNVLCMDLNSELQRVVTGGKENLVKLWDLNKPEQPIFKAKNVRPDWLEHRVPVWVTGLKFIPNSNKILSITGTHNIRVFDPKSNTRRPVLETSYEEYPLTAVDIVARNPNQVVVGNTHGDAAMFDIRKIKHVARCYKGFAGSIREIRCHPSLPYFFSCSLDRHLRVHHERYPKVEHKVYLKSRLTCLLATDAELEVKNDEKEPETEKRKTEKDVWDELDDADSSESDSESDNDLLPRKKKKQSS